MALVELSDKDLLPTQEAKLSSFAKIIMEKYKLKTYDDTKEILYYNDGVCLPGGEVIIKKECEELIEECSNYKVNEIIGIIQRRTFASRKDFNSDLSKLVLENGILDIDTAKLSSFNPDYLSTIKIPVPFDPKAKCPKFIKFLRDCHLNHENIITILELMANILTTNRKNFEVITIFTGDGANGKSTLLKIIYGIFGADNCSNVSIHSLEYDRFSTSLLYGKLINFYADISNKELNNLGKTKQLVSGEPIAVEKKGRDHFTLQSYAKHFFSCNEMPNIKDNSDGIFRRIYVIKWENQFLPGVNRIEDYDKEILSEEKSGIFNLILHNYRRLMKNNGFTYKQSIAKVREIIKNESDKLREFIQECFIEDPNGYISKDEFYSIYHKYMNDKNYEIFSKQKLGANLPTYGLKNDTRQIKNKTQRVWKGFSLKKDDEWVKTNVKNLQEILN